MTQGFESIVAVGSESAVNLLLLYLLKVSQVGGYQVTTYKIGVKRINKETKVISHFPGDSALTVRIALT